MRPLERYMLPCDTGNPAEQERLRAWHATYNAALQPAIIRERDLAIGLRPDDYARAFADRAHGRVGRVMFHEVGLPEYRPCDTRVEHLSEDNNA